MGDLRIAAHYATRERQNTAQRLYFVRLTAAHLREVLLIMDPPNRTYVPSVEEFLASLPWGTKPSRTVIRKSHGKAVRLVDRAMARGRPMIIANGNARSPTLRDDLKELRNRFFHYGWDEPGDEAIRAAMASLAGERTGYWIREHTLRAEYADDVGTKLAHPFPLAFAPDMHARIIELIEPISLFIHQVEAAWLHANRDVVSVKIPGMERVTLREFLGRAQ